MQWHHRAWNRQTRRTIEIFYVQGLHGKPRCTIVGEVVTEQLFPAPEDLSVPGWCRDPAPACSVLVGISRACWILGNDLFPMAITDRSVWHTGLFVLLVAVKLSEWEESCNGFILRVNICRVLFCSTTCTEVFSKVHNRLTTPTL